MNEAQDMLNGMFLFFVLPALVWWLVTAVQLGRAASGHRKHVCRGAKCRKS
jgi:hypothetical protein